MNFKHGSLRFWWLAKWRFLITTFKAKINIVLCEANLLESQRCYKLAEGTISGATREPIISWDLPWPLAKA